MTLCPPPESHYWTPHPETPRTGSGRGRTSWSSWMTPWNPWQQRGFRWKEAWLAGCLWCYCQDHLQEVNMRYFTIVLPKKADIFHLKTVLTVYNNQALLQPKAPIFHYWAMWNDSITYTTFVKNYTVPFHPSIIYYIMVKVTLQYPSDHDCSNAYKTHRLLQYVLWNQPQHQIIRNNQFQGNNCSKSFVGKLPGQLTKIPVQYLQVIIWRTSTHIVMIKHRYLLTICNVRLVWVLLLWGKESQR
jgi:hypothetical protein